MAYNHKFEEMCADGETFGPIPEAAVAAAEADLNVRFPQQYRDFLQRFGAGLFGGAEIYGLPDPEQDDPPFWQDVVKVTKQLREWGQAGAENPAYIPIADDGTGVYFFLDTKASPITKILAIGPGVERAVSTDLFAFVIELSKGRIQL
ncbi:SMI1/KNR4 family protein (plasmid) [Aquicoccus sp. G2-2]|uniref:SMI1/KNR4 family protein n=1 Tax=Aquicoccus sp. G2-2 TaxID=3092120 RepID=UPI002AE05997|nr:SMI1/KNR4 family protein [Aquicoccus sp. G2-2]MEA1111948.1 SMI1/KNR4 family protein [Aquicoccus sp. G2-2]